MKKILLGLGSIAAVATPVATVVACGSKDIDYLVTVDNSKDKNYVLSTVDRNFQPVSYVKDSFEYWDALRSIKDSNVAMVAAFGKDEQNINPSVKSGNPYKNGLEWLIYDVLLAENHNIDLTLVASGIGAKKPFVIDAKTMETGSSTKDKATARAAFIKTNVAKFIESFVAIKLIEVDSTTKKISFVEITDAIVTTIVDDMLLKIK